MKHVISPSAIKDLAKWEAIASQWPEEVTDDGYLRCGECTQAMARITDRHGTHYDMSAGERLALKVAHIRQRHPEADNGPE